MYEVKQPEELLEILEREEDECFIYGAYRLNVLRFKREEEAELAELGPYKGGIFTNMIQNIMANSADKKQGVPAVERKIKIKLQAYDAEDIKGEYVLLRKKSALISEPEE